jgi:chaperone required for assembly of F1-ATPase
MKRFYKEAKAAPTESGFQVLLDGRPVKTPARQSLILPTEALAEAIAEEWRGQGDEIVPTAMPLLRLANSAQDGVRQHRAATIEAVLKFGASDLLSYRAEDAALAARQRSAWDPLLAWAEFTLDAGLKVTDGIAHVSQPEGALAALEAALDARDDFELAALHVLASITGSLVLAMAVAGEKLDAAEAFALSRLDESFQQERWGTDHEAEQRAKALAAEMDAAARFLVLARH